MIAARASARRRRHLWGFSFALAALCFLGGRALAAEVIQSFDTNVEVAKDSDLTVTETLRVHAEGSEMRHGIYRDFPYTFKDAGGTVREVTFKLLGVSRDGKKEPYHTERSNGVVRIYAGDKDVLLPRGDHTYVFRYRTGRQVRWFDGKPELNWNVTGSFWRFPILQTTYHLHLSGDARPLRWTAFTGRLGARGTDWRADVSPLGTLNVSTSRRLPPGEGLTVVAALPEDAVEAPTQATLLWYQLFDNRAWIFGGIGFVVVLIYYLAAWDAVGRDPRRGTIIPLFHPPQGISPALANYIHNWGLTREKWRAFTAAALSLAVRGLVKLNYAGKTLTLSATGNDPQGRVPLSSEERTIVTKLNGSGGSVVIDRAHATTVADLGSKFTSAVELENRNRFFRRNLGYVAIGILMTAAVVIGIIAFGGLRDEDLAILFGVGFGSFFVGMFFVPILLAVLGRGAKITVLARLVMTVAIIGVFFSIGTSVVSTVLPNGFDNVLPQLETFLSNYPFPFVLVGAFAMLNGLFLHLMGAPTALGRPVMDQLDGFRLYLETAEKDRLNMQAPEVTADRFEALLPYAVALDVEKPWSDAFAAALKRAHPDDPDPMRHYQPTWNSGGGWSSGNFSNSVASTVSSVSSAFASAVPASSGSSGFSGGGGSGGGGGGGGGGGW